MYTHYFSLKQPPFSIAPDPRYLFMSERHREALAHLLYGVKGGGGFVLLTGEIGAGKTTVCRCFIEQVPADCRLAYIFNPKLTVEELLLSICDEFRIEPARPPAAGGVKGYVDAINRYLLDSHAQGNNNVLIIDEAQNLSADVLEQLRLLTNLETSERKLLQIILIGQPELRTMLARPELEQLAQRVIARYHLGSLSGPETAAYVAHRLAVAGATAAAPFPPSLTGPIYRLTQGVPRRINLLCDRALLGAYVENSREVTRAILRRAGAEVFAGSAAPASQRRGWSYLAGGVMAGAALGAAAAAAWQVLPHRAAPPVPALAASAAKAAAASAATAAVPAPAPNIAVAAATTHASANAALRELGALWGQALPAGEACQAALQLHLRCHQGKASLAELRLLDRPAVLTLDDGARVAFALLTGLDDNSASLRQGGKAATLGLAALASRFNGEFTTFWRVPRGFAEQVGEGESGPQVDWIAARLAESDGRPARPAGQAFDAPLRERLRNFQAAHQLKADGVAGPRTFMRLNQSSGVAEPRLRAAGASGK